MSKEVIIKVRDDFDGSDADETVTFTYRGTVYEIDLNATNAESYDKALEPYVTRAREVVPEPSRYNGGKRRAAAGAAIGGLTHRQARLLRAKVRQWGIDNGYQVSDRARIPNEVYLGYKKEHPEFVLPGIVRAQDLAKVNGSVSALAAAQE